MSSRFCLYSHPLSSMHSYYEMIDFASKYGIKQVETLNMFEFSAPDFRFAIKLKKYAVAKGISFPCVSAGLNLVGDDYLEMIEVAKKYVDIAVILGAPYFHHTIALELENPSIIAENKELFYTRGLVAVRTIFDYAKQHNVRTIYEDQGFLFNGVDNFKQFLSDVDRNVGIVADFGNVHFVDESIPNFISTFSDRIVHVHVKDYIITAGTSRSRQPNEYVTPSGNYLLDCLIGQGDVPVSKAFRQLQAVGYAGSISVETPAIGADEEASFRQNFATVNAYINNYL